MGNGITGNVNNVVSTRPTGLNGADSILGDFHWDLKSDRTISYSTASYNYYYDYSLKKPGVPLGDGYPGASLIKQSIMSIGSDEVLIALVNWSQYADFKVLQLAETASSAGDIRAINISTDLLKSNKFTDDIVNTTVLARPPAVNDSNGSPGDFLIGNNNFKSPIPLRPLLLKEVGIALGLKAPNTKDTPNSYGSYYLSDAENNSAYTIMSSNQNEKLTGVINNQKYINGVNGPSMYDIAAIQSLYGANMSAAPGNNSYYLDTGGFRTIWDPNGDNVINGGGGVYDQILDANEMSFSYFNNVLWLALAKGTRITGLKGGYGNDTLIGNPLDNRLEGSAGDDTIIGGGGEDTAVYSSGRVRYKISQDGNKTIVEDITPSDGTVASDGKDTLVGITWLQFGNGERLKIAGAPDPIGVAISDQLSVVYLGRGVGADLRDATAMKVANGASADVLKSYYASAVADRAFAATDSLQTLTNKVFLNIFGVEASKFEQDAWANTVSAGYVSREALPWAMFNSYLAATNVPKEYQIPAQSRIIAAHAFTQAITFGSDKEKALGAAGVSSAEAARAWLLPIRGQGDAAVKVLNASSAVNSFSTKKAGGPLDPIGDYLASPDHSATDALPLVGVTAESPFAIGAG